ncbi:MAG: cobyric acid synthase [Chloroflexi bacterium]|nr:cobyric acid synthase [Chloroflexota bacterium]
MASERRAKVLMVQGTTSHAGKSVLVTALCRSFARQGYAVAPFKSQNMSLNSYVTIEGGEIGRAQAVQAEAAMAIAHVDMNPILLKPEGERKSQVVVLGRPTQALEPRAYYQERQRLWPIVTQALDRLRREYDIVVIEGAGSPAEINLREHEIVNMRVARYADAPIVLVGDIDRGGVFASLYGTVELLRPEERALVQALVINKMRGDHSLLEPGIAELRARTGIPIAGVLPYFADIHIPEEDSLGLDPSASGGATASLDIAVVRLPHLANFDDFDPFRREPGVRLRFVASAAELGSPDLIIIPGSKTTIADLHWLRAQGMDEAIIGRRRAGTPIVGICGGYQMLGRRILDPKGVESPLSEADGLGLLPHTTIFELEKATHQVQAVVRERRGLLSLCGDEAITGYEIHMGQTGPADAGAPFAFTRRSGRAVALGDGQLDAEGLTLGSYMHGLFHNAGLRRALLRRLAQGKGVALPGGAREFDQDKEYDRLADFVERHLDMTLIRRIAGLERVSV